MPLFFTGGGNVEDYILRHTCNYNFNHDILNKFPRSQ